MSSSISSHQQQQQQPQVRMRTTTLKPLHYPPDEQQQHQAAHQSSSYSSAAVPPSKIVVSHPLSPNPSSSNINTNNNSSSKLSSLRLFFKIMCSPSDKRHWNSDMEFWWRLLFALSVVGLFVCAGVVIYELKLKTDPRSEYDWNPTFSENTRSNSNNNNNHRIPASDDDEDISWSNWLMPWRLKNKKKDLVSMSAFQRAELVRDTQSELRAVRDELSASKSGLVRLFEKKFFRERTIFVSIASFRDVKCRVTVQDIFETAANPRRVFLGIIEQNENGDPTCIPDRFQTECILKPLEGNDNNHHHQFDPRNNFFCPLDNIRRRRVVSKNGRGPTFGRYVSMLMYRGESYYMMIDSHNRFKPRWDIDATKMIFLADSKKPVLSHYPLAWNKNTNFERPQFTTVMCRSHFVSFGYVRMGGLNFVNSKRPRLQPFTAAGFVFADAAMIHEVPFDPHLDFLFDGEELIYTVRLYTHGWDSFSPAWNIVFHDYERHTAPRFWHIAQNQWGVYQQRSVKRVQWMLKIPKKGKDMDDLIVPDQDATAEIKVESERYGLGFERSLESFWKFANVDLLNKVDTMGVCEKYLKRGSR